MSALQSRGSALPHPRGHYYLLLQMILMFAAFWPGYFSILGKAPIGFHLHGITSALWLLLLMMQSWTAHNGRYALHGQLGRASLALFPFLIGGMAAVILSMGQKAAAGNPFHAIYGAKLTVFALLSFVAVPYFYFCALVHLVACVTSSQKDSLSNTAVRSEMLLGLRAYVDTKSAEYSQLVLFPSNRSGFTRSFDDPWTVSRCVSEKLSSDSAFSNSSSSWLA